MLRRLFRLGPGADQNFVGFGIKPGGLNVYPVGLQLFPGCCPNHLGLAKHLLGFKGCLLPEFRAFS